MAVPEKEYQEYCSQIKNWEKKEAEINGDTNQPETIRGLEYQINYIQRGLKEDINTKYAERKNISKEIYACIEDERDIYNELYRAC